MLLTCFNVFIISRWHYVINYPKIKGANRSRLNKWDETVKQRVESAFTIITIWFLIISNRIKVKAIRLDGRTLCCQICQGIIRTRLVRVALLNSTLETSTHTQAQKYWDGLVPCSSLAVSATAESHPLINLLGSIRRNSASR